jgi:lipopolysaccharide/colanic/teichoic acid biosynthesis glycosyltransferase
VTALAPNLRPAHDAATPQNPGAQLPTRVWGLSSADLHDRYWASKRVQVVRLGCGTFASKGPAMYLLSEPGDLVLFDLAPRIKQFNRVKPRALRLRVRDDNPRPYGERVVSDGEDRFIAIRRSYNALTRSTARVWLTPDRHMAKLWATAKDLASARRAIKDAAGPQRIASAPCQGRVFDLATEGAAWINVLMARWKDPGLLVDDIYEFQPGIWLHEAVEVPESARFVAPAWVGAGSKLDTGHVLIGPSAVPDAPGVHAPVGDVDWANMSVPGYRLLPRVPNRRIGRIFKRAFDVFFSLLVLTVTAPLYPLIILAIWLEDGWPAFFAHTRQTIHGRSFPCYKFRTMCRNAEQIKAQLVAANICDGPQFYIADDPRLLRVGKLLRRCQLDELPQFWNVLLGHMSIVGPRPSPDRENQFCPAWREARLSVRPGITGLWQVRRTRVPQTDFQEWIRYDLEYVQHASWRLDMWIIMLTIKKVIGG